MAPDSSSPRVVLIPFMSKGHTIPIIHLARLLLRRGIAVTFFTTPANSPFIRHSLSDTQASVVDLPFPENVLEIPAGVESTDRLPSMSLFYHFANSTKLIQPHFERALEALPSVSFMVSDAFLPWTQKSASRFGIPWFISYGTNNYSMTLTRVVFENRLHTEVDSDDEPFTVPSFPWIKLTRNDFDHALLHPGPINGPQAEFFADHGEAVPKCEGIVVNSFYELEPVLIDYTNREFESKTWCVGPLCLAQPPRVEPIQSVWMQWLDTKLVEGRTVLYVAFGSQAEISSEQSKEIAIGLERSEGNFLWVVNKYLKGLELVEGFEERVKGRGLVVREWVDQRGILGHESVAGFMSHCGWNSVLESICASVPILAWPMLAEQHLNARMVHEELGISLRVGASNGSVRGFVTAEVVERTVREMMEGEKGKEVRKKVKEVEKAARRAMQEGGSSWRALDLLIEDTCKKLSG